MRTVTFETSYLLYPAGSCMVSCGNTKVICTASIESRVPSFLEGTGKGWVTAEYAMLPGSTGGGRKRREIGKRDGRSTEIQRLIGRSLRAAVNMDALGETSIVIDCDVIQADGGTRTASISGGWVALYGALTRLAADQGKEGARDYLRGQVAAISVGIVDGEVVCDLDYAHDSRADVDMNIVKMGNHFVEIQGTGEKTTFSAGQLAELITAAEAGLSTVFELQLEAVGLAAGFTFSE
jgi:ribonuclease PH